MCSGLDLKAYGMQFSTTLFAAFASFWSAWVCTAENLAQFSQEIVRLVVKKAVWSAEETLPSLWIKKE